MMLEERDPFDEEFDLLLKVIGEKPEDKQETE